MDVWHEPEQNNGGCMLMRWCMDVWHLRGCGRFGLDRRRWLWAWYKVVYGVC